MDLLRVEQLQREFTDKYVVVHGNRPELARFQGITGRVKTVNMSGQALVEFDAYNNIGWYDISPVFLKVIDAPLPPKETPKAEPKAAAPKPAAAKPAAAPKPTGGSTADILAAARGGKPATPAAPAGEKKPSTADILAAARRPSAPEAKAAPEAARPAAEPKKQTTAEILAAARGKAAPAAAVPAAKAAPKPEPVAAAPEPEPKPAPVVEAAPAAKSSAKGSLPKDIPGMLAYCRQTDGK